MVITGAAGNLGAKLRAHLQAEGGYELRLLDVDPHGDAAIRQADLAQSEPAWTKLFDGADAVVHLAANSRSDADWPDLIGPNIDATLNVYLAAVQHRVPRVVFASSVWAMAARAEGSEPITAGDPDPGGNRYGATKLFGERLARSFAASHGVTSVILRIGACREGDNPAFEHEFDPWEDRIWLSNRDFCQGLELAINAKVDGVLTANLISDNPGSRWTLDEAREGLGYAPQDGATPSPAPAEPQAAPPQRTPWRARLRGKFAPGGG